MKAFMPFGGGARICPGKNLSMIEMKAVFSMICRNFQLSPPQNGKTPYNEFNFVAGPKDLWVRFQGVRFEDTFSQLT